MTQFFLLSLLAPDQSGLISRITAELFDMGINLGDTSFAVLGEGAEFSAVLEMPEGLSEQEVLAHVTGLKELDQAKVQLMPFAFRTLRGETGTITHHVSFQGDDQPGLIARLTEILSDYGANVVRMDTRIVSKADAPIYIIELWVWIPEARKGACLAAMNNTAASLGMKCEANSVD